MVYRILYAFFLVLFVSACSTTKDTADSSGSGSSGEFNTATDESGSGKTVDTSTSDFSGVISGTAEDFIVSVGDRVYFDYDSAELDADAKELLQSQAAWIKQYNKTSIIIEGHCDEKRHKRVQLSSWRKESSGSEKLFKWFGNR